MDGKQEFDIVDEDMKQLGFFWIFSKYLFLPLLIVGIIGAAIYFGLPYIKEMDFPKEGAGITAMLLLIIIIIATK